MNRLFAMTLILCTASAFGGDAFAGKLGTAVNNAQPTAKQQDFATVCQHPGYGPCSQRGICHPPKGPDGQVLLKCEQ